MKKNNIKLITSGIGYLVMILVLSALFRFAGFPLSRIVRGIVAGTIVFFVLSFFQSDFFKKWMKNLKDRFHSFRQK